MMMPVMTAVVATSLLSLATALSPLDNAAGAGCALQGACGGGRSRQNHACCISSAGQYFSDHAKGGRISNISAL